MIDENYDKYLHITYEWIHSSSVQTGPRVYGLRHEKYEDKEYYVIGIGVSNFLEPNGYDPKKDWVNDPNINHDRDYNPKELIKWMCGSSFVSIDDLYNLSNQLKEAGAKEVYIHPSYWTDNKALLDHYTADEWLIVIPK